MEIFKVESDHCFTASKIIAVADPLNTTGKRIRILRNDLDLTQTEVARQMEKIGTKINASYLSTLEGSEKIPSGEVLRGLAQVLGTTTDYLLLLTDESKIPGELDEEAREVSDQEWELVTALRSLPDPDRQTLSYMVMEMINVARRQRQRTGRNLIDVEPAVPAAQVPRVPRSREDLVAVLSVLPEDLLESLLSGAADIIRSTASRK